MSAPPTPPVIELADRYSEWFEDLHDLQARSRILARIRRLELGNPGDHRNLSGGITEMRVDYGPGYRIYYTVRVSGTIILLLCGGDKTTQQEDIATAQSMVSELKKTKD